jgi:hypothetical protein
MKRHPPTKQNNVLKIVDRAFAELKPLASAPASIEETTLTAQA